MLAGHWTIWGKVILPWYDRRLFWGQGVHVASRDIGFIGDEWFWL